MSMRRGVQAQAYRGRPVALPQIPPTAVGGLFKSSLQRKAESGGFPNPTHGSGWIVQVQPTKEGRSRGSPNPTHGSGWMVQVQPTKEGRSRRFPNPTHGSGWIVQVQPTKASRA